MKGLLVPPTASFPTTFAPVSLPPFNDTKAPRKRRQTRLMGFRLDQPTAENTWHVDVHSHLNANLGILDIIIGIKVYYPVVVISLLVEPS